MNAIPKATDLVPILRGLSLGPSLTISRERTCGALSAGTEIERKALLWAYKQRMSFAKYFPKFIIAISGDNLSHLEQRMQC